MAPADGIIFPVETEGGQGRVGIFWVDLSYRCPIHNETEGQTWRFVSPISSRGTYQEGPFSRAALSIAVLEFDDLWAGCEMPGVVSKRALELTGRHAEKRITRKTCR
jgi:hypothetical protein